MSNRIQIGKVIGSISDWKKAVTTAKFKTVRLRQLLRAVGAPNKNVKSANKAALIKMLDSILFDNGITS